MENWKISGKTIDYDNDTHTYIVDGTKSISVTQLLQKKFSEKYKDIPEEVLKKAANKGNEMHEAIEMYCKYGLPSEDLIEFRNFLFLQDAFKFKVLENEVPVLFEYKNLKICGRLDLVLLENDLLMLGDLKRTSKLDKEYLTYQLNIYRLAFQQSYNKEVKGLRGIWLRNDKRKYLTLPINEAKVYELLDWYIKEKEKEEE